MPGIGPLTQAAQQGLATEQAIAQQHRLFAGIAFARQRIQRLRQLTGIQRIERAQRVGQGGKNRAARRVDDSGKGRPDGQFVGRQARNRGDIRRDVQGDRCRPIAERACEQAGKPDGRVAGKGPGDLLAGGQDRVASLERLSGEIGGQRAVKPRNVGLQRVAGGCANLQAKRALRGLHIGAADLMGGDRTGRRDTQPARVVEAGCRPGGQRDAPVDDPGVDKDRAIGGGAGRERVCPGRSRHRAGIQERAESAFHLHAGTAGPGNADGAGIADDAVGFAFNTDAVRA